MATLEQLQDALINAHKAGDVDAARQLADAITAQKTGYGDVAINAPPKAVAGTIDALLNAPTNLLNLGKAAFGTAASAAGRTDLMPDLTPTPDFARRGFEKIGLINPKIQPQSSGQRTLDMALQGATGGLMNPSGSIGQMLGTAATGAATGAASQQMKEATGSDLAGILTALAVPAAVSGLRNMGQSRLADMAQRRAQNAPRDQALQAGQEAGYKVPPATVSPSLTNKALESVAGKAATQQDVSLNNVDVTNKLARRAIGLSPDTPITPEVTRQVRAQAFEAGYKPIENLGNISTGRLYRQDLNDITAKYEGAARSFPEAVRADVTDMVNRLRVRSFDAGDAIKMSDQLRTAASKSFRDGDSALGLAQRQASTAIENQIERHLAATNNQSLLQNFRDARQQMAKAHSVEDAITVGTGNVDANKLANALQSGAPLSGDLRTIAEFAQNFRKAVQTPQTVGSPGVSKAAALASMFLGGGGAAVGGPTGAALGAVPLFAPPLTRGAILSDLYQKRLAPDYSGGILGRLGELPEMPVNSVLPALFYTEEMRNR